MRPRCHPSPPLRPGRGLSGVPQAVAAAAVLLLVEVLLRVDAVLPLRHHVGLPIPDPPGWGAVPVHSLVPTFQNGKMLKPALGHLGWGNPPQTEVLCIKSRLWQKKKLETHGVFAPKSQVSHAGMPDVYIIVKMMKNHISSNRNGQPAAFFLVTSSLSAPPPPRRSEWLQNFRSLAKPGGTEKNWHKSGTSWKGSGFRNSLGKTT